MNPSGIECIAPDKAPDRKLSGGVCYDDGIDGRVGEETAMIKFYHAPWSRASGTLWLLEELGQPYEIERVDIRAPGGVPESYRAIQPNKKVPAIVHDGTVVTERAAICLYLTEKFPEAELAPAIGDKDRAAFLSWLVYCDFVFDPAVAAKAQGWKYAPTISPSGPSTTCSGMSKRRFPGGPISPARNSPRPTPSWAAASTTPPMCCTLCPKGLSFKAYLDRVTARPAFQRSAAKDYEMAKEAGMAGAA